MRTCTLYAKDGTPVVVNEHELLAFEAAKSPKERAALFPGVSGPDFATLSRTAPKAADEGKGDGK